MELEEKQLKINAILDGAEKELEALGVPYFMAAVDRDQRDPDGGKVFVVSDVKGQDMQIIFKHAFPANKDIAALGLWVGAEIMRRNKDANIKFRNKKDKKPVHTDKCGCKDCVKSRLKVVPGGPVTTSEEEAAAEAESALENLRYRVRMARIKAVKKGRSRDAYDIYKSLNIFGDYVTFENQLDEAQLNNFLIQLTNIFNN